MSSGWVPDFEYVEMLEVAVGVGCVGTCFDFCPQEVMVKSYGKRGPRFMSLADFKRILSTVPRSVYIDFAGLIEPFQNKDFLDMVEHARREGFQVGVKTTLIGASVADVKRLASLNPCCVFIHLPDGVHLKAPDTEEYRKALIAGLKYIRNAQLSLMNALFVSNLREVTVRGQAKKKSGFGQCYRRDHPQLVVFPDGSTVLCCIDIRLEHVFGNLIRENYATIRARFRRQHHYKLCETCGYNVTLPHYYFRKWRRKLEPILARALSLWKSSV